MGTAVSKERLLAMNRKFDLKYGDEKEYTCHECADNKTCDYAWDLYNINGECIAEK